MTKFFDASMPEPQLAGFKLRVTNALPDGVIVLADVDTQFTEHKTNEATVYTITETIDIKGVINLGAEDGSTHPEP